MITLYRLAIAFDYIKIALLLDFGVAVMSFGDKVVPVADGTAAKRTGAEVLRQKIIDAHEKLGRELKDAKD